MVAVRMLRAVAYFIFIQWETGKNSSGTQGREDHPMVSATLSRVVLGHKSSKNDKSRAHVIHRP